MELEEALSKGGKNIEELEQKLAEILKLLPDSYFYTGYEDEQDNPYERYYMDLTGHKIDPIFLGLISKDIYKKEMTRNLESNHYMAELNKREQLLTIKNNIPSKYTK